MKLGSDVTHLSILTTPAAIIYRDTLADNINKYKCGIFPTIPG